jgi:hypothetical protein
MCFPKGKKWDYNYSQHIVCKCICLCAFVLAALFSKCFKLQDYLLTIVSYFCITETTLSNRPFVGYW